MPPENPSPPGDPERTWDRVLLVHGFGASTEDHWFPWLAERIPGLERVELPASTAPDAATWISTVAAAIGTFDARTAVVTHSLDGVTAIRALQLLAGDGDDGRIGALVAVAPFVETLPPIGDPELDTFLSTRCPAFTDAANLDAIRDRVGRTVVIRSDDDPVVPADASDRVGAGLGAPVVVVAGAGHFLGREGVTELPEVLEALGIPVVP